ncbi:MAG TPA: hypothetical protein VM121_01250 [Acidimicrobiales bacterium]|nr:hypothetical protein [Acidimicrobiales bacterium]
MDGKGAARRWVRTRPLRSMVAVAVMVTLGAGACSDGKFRYVTSAATKTYLKVPSAYAAFDQPELLDAEAKAAQQSGDPAPSDVDTFIENLVQWRVAYDSDPVPSLEHITGFNPAPIIDVRVRGLLDSERDRVSTSDLRNLFVPYDNLKRQAEEDAQQKPLLSPTNSKDFRAIDETELHLDGGLRGVHLVFEVRDPEKPEQFYIFDQTALLDAKTSRVWVLLVRAGEQEYLSNADTLDEVVGSFTIKQKV